MDSSNRQFGFKRGLGCVNAIFRVRKVIDHFTSNNSTVNICTVDLSKAFDRVIHDVLFVKLMDRRVPLCLLTCIMNWYSKMFCCVKWGNALSVVFGITAGVRQGGILSPALFSVYVNGILTKLAQSNRGCFIQHECVNSFMYADDLILLAISIRDLQLLVDRCDCEFKGIGMIINSKKTSCLRVGKRHTNSALPITVGINNVIWKSELKYLGITLLSANVFKTINNWQGRNTFVR